MTPARYCSSCGAKLPSRPPVTCDTCGTQHWLNPKPCANAVVVEDDKVLLVRRAQSPWRGAWCSPGGFCDLGEHPIETVQREVLEETALHVAVTGYIGVWVDSYADGPDADADTINVAYYHAVPLSDSSSSVNDAEVSEVRWFGWNELPSDLAPPETLPAVLAAARLAHLEGTAVTSLPDARR